MSDKPPSSASSEFLPFNEEISKHLDFQLSSRVESFKNNEITETGVGPESSKSRTKTKKARSKKLKKSKSRSKSGSRSRSKTDLTAIEIWKRNVSRFSPQSSISKKSLSIKKRSSSRKESRNSFAGIKNASAQAMSTGKDSMKSSVTLASSKNSTSSKRKMNGKKKIKDLEASEVVPLLLPNFSTEFAISTLYSGTGSTLRSSVDTKPRNSSEAKTLLPRINTTGSKMDVVEFFVKEASSKKQSGSSNLFLSRFTENTSISKKSKKSSKSILLEKKTLEDATSATLPTKRETDTVLNNPEQHQQQQPSSTKLKKKRNRKGEGKPKKKHSSHKSVTISEPTTEGESNANLKKASTSKSQLDAGAGAAVVVEGEQSKDQTTTKADQQNNVVVDGNESLRTDEQQIKEVASGLVKKAVRNASKYSRVRSPAIPPSISRASTMDGVLYLQKVQNYINQLGYHREGEPEIEINMQLSMKCLMGVARSIIKAGARIKCLHALILGSKFEGKPYKHVVLGVYIHGRFGALGISRDASLQDKAPEYARLSELIDEYFKKYSASGHSLKELKIGPVINRDKLSMQRITWDLGTVSFEMEPSLIEHNIERIAKKLRNQMGSACLRGVKHVNPHNLGPPSNLNAQAVKSRSLPVKSRVEIYAKSKSTISPGISRSRSVKK